MMEKEDGDCFFRTKIHLYQHFFRQKIFYCAIWSFRFLICDKMSICIIDEAEFKIHCVLDLIVKSFHATFCFLASLTLSLFHYIKLTTRNNQVLSMSSLITFSRYLLSHFPLLDAKRLHIKVLTRLYHFQRVFAHELFALRH